ncbi:MAG: M56 family metallopeptidase [Planctomycetaceae bacterium]|nr:M56 family metallopeptidase [Planctomycetaceae bacterium]
MLNDLLTLADPAVVLIATYLLHSTLWLGAVWLLLRLYKRSWTISERLWRWATVLPLLTTCGTFIIVERPSFWSLNVFPVAGDISPEEEPHVIIPLPAIPSRSGKETPHFASPAVSATFPVIDDISSVPIPEESDRPPMVTLGESPFVPPAPDLPVESSSESAGNIAFSAIETPNAIAVFSRSLPRYIPVIVGMVLLWVSFGIVRVIALAIHTRKQIGRMNLVTSGTAFTTLQELREIHGIRSRIRLLVGEDIHEPAACGLWNWTIVIPSRLEKQLNDRELRAAMTHELAHLERGDVVWMWVGRLLTSAFGWQPLNWLAVRRWREASEHLCDDWTIDHGISPVTLAKCLTRVAEWKLVGTAPAAALTLSGRRSLLTRRIERLTTSRHPDRWQSPARSRTLSIGLLLATLLLTWTGPRITGATPDDTPQPTPAAESPTAPKRSSTDNSDIRSDLTALRHDLNYALDLLANSEPDEEITALVAHIRQRLDALENVQPQQE